MTDQVTLTIDGREVSVPPDTLVVDAAEKLNIEIPVFCSHPKLDPVACCRMCLVEIDIPGPRSRGPMLMTACSVPVAEGMVVHTRTEQVQSVQEANLAFILMNHPLDCPICDKGGECPLQDQTMRYGPGISDLVEPKRRKKKHYQISDTITLDQERCVVCWRCIRYLDEWEDKHQLELFERGGETIIDIQPGQPVDAKTSGNIIDICPVGALTNSVSRFGYRSWQVERTPSIDPHFSTGDNIRIDTRSHEIRRIVGRENMQVNDQWIADKTRFAFEWVNSEERLTVPLVRVDGELQPATWQDALNAVFEGLTVAKEKSGADAIGGIGSTKLSNESNYLFQRYMRQVMGSNNVDHRNGGDVAALATGLPALADLMKPQYGPDPKIDTVFLLGFDPEEEAPVLNLHLKRAARRAGVKLIVAHPREIELTRYDGPYLGYKPGTEATLINGVTRLALETGADSNDDVGELVADATNERLAELCGVDVDAVREAAKLLVESENALIAYGPMAAKGGEAVRNGLTNLSMLTGHYENLAYIGLDANSQGCRDMGLLPDALPGHASLADEGAVKYFQDVWGCELPAEPGKSYEQMLETAGNEIKALYIMGANPASERPAWADNLGKLEFLVVQELFLTETAQKADVVLPAVSWAETDGTYTNVERRVQRAPKAVSNPANKGAADTLILDHLASRFDVEWAYGSVQAVTADIAKTVPIYEGLTWAAVGDQGLQWNAEQVRPAPEYRKADQVEIDTDEDFPLQLVAGTVAYDAGTLFSLTTQMSDMAFGNAAAFNPTDASTFGLDENDSVKLSSAYGSLNVTAKLSEQVRPGTIWLPESLAGAPVGALLNGRNSAAVRVDAESDA